MTVQEINVIKGKALLEYSEAKRSLVWARHFVKLVAEELTSLAAVIKDDIASLSTTDFAKLPSLEKLAKLQTELVEAKETVEKTKKQALELGCYVYEGN